ncbi:UNVERIFIED_CONTAM: hypothetical protein K2H54_035048, partial [Gekko kuhli]
MAARKGSDGFRYTPESDASGSNTGGNDHMTRKIPAAAAKGQGDSDVVKHAKTCAQKGPILTPAAILKPSGRHEEKHGNGEQCLLLQQQCPESHGQSGSLRAGQNQSYEAYEGKDDAGSQSGNATDTGSPPISPR